MTLPKGWATATVEELAGVGGLVSDGDWVESKDQDPSGEVRLTQLADVGEGIFRDRSARFMARNAAERLRCTYLTAGDVLIARMPDPIGRACVFPGLNRPAVTAVDVMIWRTDSIISNAEWFARWINSPVIRKAMADGAGGTTRQRIAGGRVKELELPTPPLAEQRRIVSKLDALTARLARARAELDRVPVLAANLRRGVLARAFSGELTADWRVERGLTDIEWPMVSLGDLAEVQGGIQVGKKRPVGAALVDTPYLRVANVQRGWLKLDEIKSLGVTPEERARLMLQNGDILMNEGGDRDKLGRGWVWRDEVAGCIHQNHVFRIRLRDSCFPPEFISHYANEFGQPYFIDQGTQTTNLASISKRRVMALPVPVPSVDEAVETVRRIGAAFARADRLEAEAARARALIDRLESAILAKAFRGELVPQDPNDEPASVLLDRIRAKRAAAPKAKRGRRA